MLFNKRHVQKNNCKKILHKVGKFWVTVSIASLSLIGARTLSTHVNANASANLNNDANANHQIDHHDLRSASATLVHQNGAQMQGLNSESATNHKAQANSSSSNANDYRKDLRDASKISQRIIGNLYNSGILEQAQQKKVSVKPTQVLSNRIVNSVAKTNLSIRNQTYLKNNEAYDLNSFQRLDGFLTANSWYRPKMIHKNGQDWVNSTSSDYRPLLMNWWPDMNTQLAYLNFMQKQGFLPAVYNGSHNLSDLESADEQVQDNVERKISQQGNTQWLHDLMNQFISSQPQWNVNSEYPKNDSLQGGVFTFHNSKLTPNANTSWRLLGRAGSPYDRLHPNHNNMELLLGNDIDHSNPIVQAEDLNNIYYTNHIGTLNGNSKGDFDGFREDATGSMDYDVTDILNRYLNDTYQMKGNDNRADAHLNILEDGSNWSQDLNTRNDHRGGLTQDENSVNAIMQDLVAAPGHRVNLGCLIYNDGSLNKNGKYDPLTHFQRDNDYNAQESWEPNFSRINVHDSSVFMYPVETIAKRNHPNYDQMNANDKFKALVEADAQYVQDEKNTNKLNIDGNQQYYNMPAAYAWLLTNKGTVPEVYYGDLFDTSKPYMSTPNIYYPAIKTLLQDRKKYVSGGQQMRMYGTDGNVNGKNAYTQQGILSSVRFGDITPNQPIYSWGDWTNKRPTTGMAVVMGEDPNFKASHNIKVFMGKAHINQTYRPSLLSTQNGIDINDQNSNLRLTTDNQGYLNIPAKYLNGVSNPQVSGSLSVWVPVGAPQNQDARMLTAQSTPQDGNVYHQNSTLDSHVLFESYSPFMPMPKDPTQSLDYVIAHNVPGTNQSTASWLQGLGITDFRFPPHYTPVQNDDSFIDAIDQIGYAFKDRYDLGNTRNTKYGNFNDLLKANEALHNASNTNEPLHTLSDLVLNQIYDLPGSQVVPVQRTNHENEYMPGSHINGQLYDDKTVSGTNEMQYQYGGKYLDQLKNDPRYHDLFTTKQISNNQTIDPNTKIRQWSAKYMNGSNIQHRGIGYVLQNPNNKQYYKNDLVPEVFINGTPSDLSESAPMDDNTMNAILALAKQRASDVANELVPQKSLANSYASADNGDATVVTDNGEVNSDVNGANSESGNVDSLVSEARAEVSAASQASSAADSYAEAADAVDSSASGAGSAAGGGNSASLASDYASAMNAYQQDLSDANVDTSNASSDANVDESLSNSVSSLVQSMASLSASDSSANSNSYNLLPYYQYLTSNNASIAGQAYSLAGGSVLDPFGSESNPAVYENGLPSGSLSAAASSYAQEAVSDANVASSAYQDVSNDRSAANMFNSLAKSTNNVSLASAYAQEAHNAAYNATSEAAVESNASRSASSASVEAKSAADAAISSGSKSNGKSNGNGSNSNPSSQPSNPASNSNSNTNTDNGTNGAGSDSASSSSEDNNDNQSAPASNHANATNASNSSTSPSSSSNGELPQTGEAKSGAVAELLLIGALLGSDVAAAELEDRRRRRE